MSNLIYIGDQPPINIANVNLILLFKTKIQFLFGDCGQSWLFDDERKTKIVYEAILRSRCKNLGECELTAEEIGEIENDL